MDFQGGQSKKIENSRGVTVNFTGNPGGQLQKNRYPQQGGYNFFLEKPILAILINLPNHLFLNFEVNPRKMYLCTNYVSVKKFSHVGQHVSRFAPHFKERKLFPSLLSCETT